MGTNRYTPTSTCAPHALARVARKRRKNRSIRFVYSNRAKSRLLRSSESIPSAALPTGSPGRMDTTRESFDSTSCDRFAAVRSATNSDKTALYRATGIRTSPRDPISLPLLQIDPGVVRRGIFRNSISACALSVRAIIPHHTVLNGVPKRVAWSQERPEPVPGLPWLPWFLVATFHESSGLGSHHGRQGLRT